MEAISYEIYSKKELAKIKAKENELALDVATKKVYKYVNAEWIEQMNEIEADREVNNYEQSTAD